MREQPFGPDPLYYSRQAGSAYTVQPPESKPINGNDIEVDTHRPCRHTVSVQHLDVDWQGPRTTAGWASLQWEGYVFTQLDVSIDARLNKSLQRPLIVAITLCKAVEFALIPCQDPQPAYIEWYRGDFYNYNADALQSKEGAAAVPHLIPLLPGTKYWLLVRTLYEVRVFGDPHGPPKVTFTIDVQPCPSPSPMLVAKKPLLVYPEVVEGRLACADEDQGAPVSVGIRNPSLQDIIVTDVSATGNDEQLVECRLLSETRLAPLSTSKVVFAIKSKHLLPAHKSSIGLNIIARCAAAPEMKWTLPFHLPLEHVRPFDSSGDYSYRLTYLFAGSPQYVVVKPPRYLSATGPSAKPTLLVLHGAGVEADDQSWRTAVPRQDHRWVLQPTGLTPWGLDWQQSSCWSYLALLDLPWYNPLRTHLGSDPMSDEYFLMGHSNGGQGAWYGLTHHTDRFSAGGLVGAGYIKLAEYVDFAWQHRRHTADPALLGILDAALSVFCNDLHASNLVGLPLTIKYGEQDDNVPPYHSRAMRTLLNQWNAGSEVKEDSWPKLIEVPDKGHFWDVFFHEDDVRLAFDAPGRGAPPKRFTVTCFDPSESSTGVYGWKITQVAVPGRMARLEVEYVDQGTSNQSVNIRVTARNVQALSIGHTASMSSMSGQTLLLSINGSSLHPLALPAEADDPIELERTASGGWSMCVGRARATHPRLLSPISLFLSGVTDTGITIVLPTLSTCSSARKEAYKSVARRWSQDILLYTSIVCTVVTDEAFCAACDGSSKTGGGGGTTLILGGPEENQVWTDPSAGLRGIDFIRHLPSSGNQSQFAIKDYIFADSSTALLYTIPPPVGNEHPSAQDLPRSKVLVLSGTDPSGIERAGRLLPVRTGTPLPEWIVVTSQADRFGGGGVVAAGWYDRHWKWSEAMSYLP